MMDTKILKYIAFLLILAGCFSSCENNTLPVQRSIIGKWERIADGLSDEAMSERTDGIYWEFFSDGTVRTYVPGYFPAEDTYGLFVGIGTYTIDADFLIRKYYDPDNGICYGEERYRYEFNKDQLKLVKDPMYIPDDNENMNEIYIVNIIIFKQIN